MKIECNVVLNLMVEFDRAILDDPDKLDFSNYQEVLFSNNWFIF